MGTVRRWRRDLARQRDERASRELTPAERTRKKALSWTVWLTVLLFFLPGINGLAGGAFGGYLLGTPKGALKLEVFPVVAWTLAAVTLLGFLFTPFLGYVTLIPAAWLLFTGVGLVLGALAGGALAEAVGRRRAVEA